MEGRLTASDLAMLPAPKAVEALDYEQILLSCKDDLQAVLDQDYPELGIEVHGLPTSDPISKLLEILAYRELYVRQRINEATSNCLLASATGDGLQTLASWLVGQQDETPEATRQRVLDEFGAYHTAGTISAYSHFAMAAAPVPLKDVHVASMQSEVAVTLLPQDADLADQPARGEDNQQLVAAVQTALNESAIRPIGHWVKVRMGTVRRYRVKARVGVSDMPGMGAVASSAQQAAIAYVSERYRLGRHVLTSALSAAIFQPGVKYAILDEPQEDLRIADDAAAYCAATDVQVTVNDRVPEELIKGLSLDNTSADTNRLSGVLEINAPEHEARLSYYGVYWADAEGRRLEGYSSIAELRAGGDRRYTFHNVSVPEGATQLVVHTGNENGEMALGVSTQIRT